MAEPLEYRISGHPIFWPVLSLVVFSVVFVLPGIFVAVSGHDLSVLLIGLALCGGTGIWSLGFWVVALHLDDTHLTWVTPMRSGRVALVDIRRVYPSRGTLPLKVIFPGIRMAHRGENALIETTERTITVTVAKGFLPFIDALRARCPGIEVTSVPRWQRVERFGRRSHISEGGG